MTGPEIRVDLDAETATVASFSSKTFAVLETGMNDDFHSLTLWVDEDVSDVGASEALMAALAPISDPCSGPRGAVTFTFTMPHSVLPPGMDRAVIRVEDCCVLPQLEAHNSPDKRAELSSGVAALLVWRIFSDSGNRPELKLTTA